jgi:hypothetical protein
LSTEEKLASIRARIDRLSQWLKEQEVSDAAPALDDQLAAFKTTFQDVEVDKARSEKTKTSRGDVVAAATDETPTPSVSDAEASPAENSAVENMVKNPALNEGSTDTEEDLAED